MVLGENHSDTQQTLEDLASLHQKQFRADVKNAIALIEIQKFDEVTPITDKLLRRAKDKFPDDATAAVWLFKLGDAYQMAYRYKEAADCLKLAVNIDEQVFGNDSTDVADDLNQLGLIYNDWGDYVLSEPY